ncbi:MAG: DNA-protecting protein DprA [Candidatus Magasanikbacteria bacterium CG10_big_fil_rev_8_21_14_0_10_47_10]|uniref:DNA-protecting protein DprA n=1 Tax=Candidatus Magasanikbacteria bacterium CG10_big_fil_rev_8_21_14_0_10_47_10 TaxID=1974652 RepID=A0A2H0TR62_9BACT|nr:MAG: DNA-protecting protein DprA [Candidatus Magasanikbacteria bacterium CG10_big_fil_rev_8_21_14_0_10_47_10]
MTHHHYLAFFSKLTAQRYSRLKQAMPDIHDIFSISPTVLKKAKWNAQSIDAFVAWQKNFSVDWADGILRQLQAHIICREDTSYPLLLQTIYDPPPFLFVQGTMPKADVFISIVGPRRCSIYGRQVTRRLIENIAPSSVCIVSGMARGIDETAHQTALDVSLPTVAVLGTGLQEHYPGLGEQIRSTGAIVSEFPPDVRGSKFTFPKRNRIIAGMCAGTVVVEAGASSGALITAQCAVDNARDVFAIPQNITSITSVGVNELMKQGAHILTDVSDLTRVLGLTKHTGLDRRSQINLTTDEKTVLTGLSQTPLHIDLLTASLPFQALQVSQIITFLELKGCIQDVGGKSYILSK